MDKPGPLGLSDKLPQPDGIAPYAGCRIPGPLGIVTDRVGHWSLGNAPALGIEALFGGSVAVPFAVGAYTYRLYRAHTEWRLSSNEVAVPAPEAGAIIERAAAQHRQNVPLLRLLESAASQLAGVHQDGTFVLVRLRPQWASERVAPSPPPSPAPKPQPAPLPQPPPAVEESAMAAAQAVTLKEAAVLGIPFCEECARAAEQQRAAEAAS